MSARHAASLAVALTVACGAPEAHSSFGLADHELRAWGPVPPGDYLVHDASFRVDGAEGEAAFELVGEWPMRWLGSGRVRFTFDGAELEGHTGTLFAPLTCTREPVRLARGGLVVEVPAGGRVALLGVGQGLARVGPPMTDAGVMSTLVALGTVGVDACEEAEAPSDAQVVPARRGHRGGACAFAVPSADEPVERLRLPPGSLVQAGEVRDGWVNVMAWAQGARIAAWIPARALEASTSETEWVTTARSHRVGRLVVPAGEVARVIDCPERAEHCTPRVLLALTRGGRTLRARVEKAALALGPADAPADGSAFAESWLYCETPGAPEGEVEIGRVSRERIRASISHRVNAVRACHERALGAWPSLQGRVVTSFVIGPTGHVDFIATSGDMPSRFVHHCVAGVVRDTRFEPPAGGGVVGVNYPFVLRSSP